MARYPEECQATVEQETGFIEALTGHPQNFMIVAMLSGELVGSCSVMAVSGHIKARHRSSLGISVEQKAWGGLGTAMIEAALRQAKENGFEQVELGVFEDNPAPGTSTKSSAFRSRAARCRVPPERRHLPRRDPDGKISLLKRDRTMERSMPNMPPRRQSRLLAIDSRRGYRPGRGLGAGRLRCAGLCGKEDRQRAVC